MSKIESGFYWLVGLTCGICYILYCILWALLTSEFPPPNKAERERRRLVRRIEQAKANAEFKADIKKLNNILIELGQNIVRRNN